MTKKHFIRLARLLREHADTTADPTQAVDIAVRDLIDGVADMCAETNPAFDRRRFIEACGF